MNDLVRLVSERFGSEKEIENPHNLVRALKHVLAPYGYAVSIHGEIIEMVRPVRFDSEKHKDLVTIYHAISGWKAKCMTKSAAEINGKTVPFWDNEFTGHLAYDTPQEAYKEAISMAVDEGCPLVYHTAEELKVLSQMDDVDRFLKEVM